MWTTALFLTLPVLAPAAGGSGAGTTATSEAMLDRVLASSQSRLERAAVVLEDHSTWDNAWEISTRDYDIRTSMNWYIGKKLGDDLELMLGFFRKLGRTEWRPPTKLRVYLFPNLTEYNAFGDQFGEFHSSLLGSFWARGNPERPLTLYFDANQTLVSMWGTHSAFHQFVEQAFPVTPDVWVSEGLASYFAIYHWDPVWGASEFRSIVNTGRFVPLRQLMQDPLDVYVNDSHERFVELGALFTYLLNYREDTRTEVNADGVVLLSPAADYIVDLLRGRDVTSHPVHELLTVELDELEADLRDFDFGY